MHWVYSDVEVTMNINERKIWLFVFSLLFSVCIILMPFILYYYFPALFSARIELIGLVAVSLCAAYVFGYLFGIRMLFHKKG